MRQLRTRGQVDPQTVPRYEPTTQHPQRPSKPRRKPPPTRCGWLESAPRPSFSPLAKLNCPALEALRERLYTPDTLRALVAEVRQELLQLARDHREGEGHGEKAEDLRALKGDHAQIRPLRQGAAQVQRRCQRSCNNPQVGSPRTPH